MKVCLGCECVDEIFYWTTCGGGPFCGECWEALNDPDQAWASEKRLAQAEEKIEELQKQLQAKRKI